jgi:hypothetical protein
LFILGFAAAALEALLIFASLRIKLTVIVLLHLSAFFRFVPPNNASPRGSQESMMASIMARDATDDGTLDAALCVGRCNGYQSKDDSYTPDQCLHFSLRIRYRYDNPCRGLLFRDVVMSGVEIKLARLKKRPLGRPFWLCLAITRGWRPS